MRYCFYLLLSLLHLLITVSINAENKNDKVYIVYTGSSETPQGAPRTDHAQLLNELVKRKKTSILQIFNKSFTGFAARLSEAEAESIAKRSGVVSVFPDATMQLHTTRSWDFLMSQTAPKNIDYSMPTSSSSHSINVSNWSSGRDTIIGIIDTGIWPQHPSLNDSCMGSIPRQWKGICMKGYNPPLNCSRKVIGARYYNDSDDPDDVITTAMDYEGHGTIIASIAAGMPVQGASYYGFAKGVARGGSPNSRIAAYRANAVGSILKAFDDAIDDGVDVISIAQGENNESIITSTISIGAFHAVEKGIIVVASAGNGGPSSGTVQNFSPWILTVAATTIDRDFQMSIVLGCGHKVIKGGGLSFLNKIVVSHLVDGRSAGYNTRESYNASNCIPGSLDGAKVNGKIVLCGYADETNLYKKIVAMKEHGVLGIIMIDNYLRQSPYLLQYTTPFVGVSEADGAQIQAYINSTRNPSATILPTEVVMNYKLAQVVGVFSSRGPTPLIKNLVKPDVAAPGVNILGATIFNDTNYAYPGMEAPLFALETGTSMSVPHVSALAATVKSWHPTWTPSAIKSAIMTTAISTTITTFTGSKATPHDIGSGEINLFGSLWPGLIYETETIDYILFLCNMGYNNTMIKMMSSTVPDNFTCPSNSNPDLISDLNYPSIGVSQLMPNVRKTVKRTVTNVGQVYSAYTITVEAPAGVHVEVVPNKLQFTKNVKKLSFQVTFTLTASSSDDDLFGSITWVNNFHNVRSPFVVSKA